MEGKENKPEKGDNKPERSGVIEIQDFKEVDEIEEELNHIDPQPEFETPFSERINWNRERILADLSLQARPGCGCHFQDRREESDSASSQEDNDDDEWYSKNAAYQRITCQVRFYSAQGRYIRRLLKKAKLKRSRLKLALFLLRAKSEMKRKERRDSDSDSDSGPDYDHHATNYSNQLINVVTE